MAQHWIGALNPWWEDEGILQSIDVTLPALLASHIESNYSEKVFAEYVERCRSKAYPNTFLLERAVRVYEGMVAEGKLGRIIPDKVNNKPVMKILNIEKTYINR